MRLGIYKGAFQYDAVNIFADHLAAACARQGVTPEIIDLRRPQAESERVARSVLSDSEALGFVGFNAIGLVETSQGEPQRFGRTLPYAAWILDHPAEHLARIADVADDLILTIDDGHAQFLRGFGLQNVSVLYHGGRAAQNIPPTDHEWDKRPIRIFMPASLGDAPAYHKQKRAELEANFGPRAAALFETVTNDLKTESDAHLIATLARHAGLKRSANLGGPELLIATCAIRYLRMARRLAVLQALDDAGVAVHLCGNGAQDLDFRHHKILAAAQFSDVQERMGQAKFVLHMNPLFGAGLHERAIYAALAGAAVVTDGNPVLNAALGDGAVQFRLDDIAGLARRLDEVESSRRGEVIAARGRARMAAAHSWDHRAAELIRTLRNARPRGAPISQAAHSG